MEKNDCISRPNSLLKLSYPENGMGLKLYSQISGRERGKFIPDLRERGFEASHILQVDRVVREHVYVCDGAGEASEYIYIPID